MSFPKTSKLLSNREDDNDKWIFKKLVPSPVSSVNNRVYYDFSTSLTKIEKQSILIN